MGALAPSAAAAASAGGGGLDAAALTGGASRPRKRLRNRLPVARGRRCRQRRSNGKQHYSQHREIIARRSGNRRGFRASVEYRINVVKTALLLGAMSALLLLLGEALGGAQGLVIGFMFAVVTNFVSYWFSDKIVLQMYGRDGGRPRPPALSRWSPRLAQRAGLPHAARCYIIPEPSPNAFATGRNPSTPPSPRPKASCGS